MRFLVLRAVLCVLAITMGTCFAAPIRIFNTGVDAAGKPLADNAVDPHWTVVLSTDPIAQGPNAYVINAASRYGPWWNQTGPRARWIGHTNVQSGTTPQGLYRFKQTFNLTGFDPASARIQGNWASDDATVMIYLNGQEMIPAGNSNPSDRATAFSLQSGFKDGENDLEFLVDNGLAQIGFIVDFTTTFVCPAVTAPPYVESQPKDVTIILGESATFTVQLAAECGNYDYQWRRNGEPLPNQNGASMSITIDQNGDYDVIVSRKGAPNLKTQSNVAKLIVLNPASRVDLTLSPETFGVTVKLSGLANANYKIEYTDRIERELSWQPLDSLVTDSEGKAETIDTLPEAGVSARYYRASFVRQ